MKIRGLTMRYTIVTGLHPSYYGYGYGFAHYIFPPQTQPEMYPNIWQVPYMTPGQHGIHHVYYYRK